MKKYVNRAPTINIVAMTYKAAEGSEEKCFLLTKTAMIAREIEQRQDSQLRTTALLSSALL
jgi:hypothetical protein